MLTLAVKLENGSHRMKNKKRQKQKSGRGRKIEIGEGGGGGREEEEEEEEEKPHHCHKSRGKNVHPKHQAAALRSQPTFRSRCLLSLFCVALMPQVGI